MTFFRARRKKEMVDVNIQIVKRLRVEIKDRKGKRQRVEFMIDDKTRDRLRDLLIIHGVTFDRDAWEFLKVVLNKVLEGK